VRHSLKQEFGRLQHFLAYSQISPGRRTLDRSIDTLTQTADKAKLTAKLRGECMLIYLKRRINFLFNEPLPLFILSRTKVICNRVETEVPKLPTLLRRAPLLIVETLNLLIRFNRFPVIVVIYV
jgi:hypothetical protein